MMDAREKLLLAIEGLEDAYDMIDIPDIDTSYLRECIAKALDFAERAIQQVYETGAK